MIRITSIAHIAMLAIIRGSKKVSSGCLAVLLPVCMIVSYLNSA